MDDCCGSKQNHNYLADFSNLQNKTNNGCEVIYFKANFPAFETQKNNCSQLTDISIPMLLVFNDYSLKNQEVITPNIAFKDKIPITGRAVLCKKSVLII
jgi:hypothetical protein